MPKFKANGRVDLGGGKVADHGDTVDLSAAEQKEHAHVIALGSLVPATGKDAEEEKDDDTGVELESMKKDELLAYAEKIGLTGVDSKATKADLIALIEKETANSGGLSTLEAAQ
jgi:hypothetical protein